ncbi:MAG TPA: hypothetical protein VN026_00840 [Bacteroidia bacterium]|jgi:hypothetical protein|nr:hypothetical protein [Bacteroidia bacterium]
MKLRKLTTKQKAIEICDIVYQQAMGDGWKPFIKARSNEICNLIIKEYKSCLRSCREHKSNLVIKNKIEYFKEVKKEIDELHK